MRTPDPGSLDNDRLRQVIRNYEARGATQRPEYRAFIEEYNRRHGGGFDVLKTVSFIRQRIGEGRFLSYGEIAELHGAEWNLVRHQIPDHLWAVVRWAHGHGFPMLSAVVVNKPNLETGTLEPDSLKGFVRAAEALGYTVDDPIAFHQDQKRRCLEWARAERGAR